MTTSENFLKGKLVQLVAHDPDRDGEITAKWRNNSEFSRMLDDSPAALYSTKASKEWIEKHLNDFLEFEFMIQDLQSKTIIGFVVLEGNMRFHQDTFVGIGIGNPDFWGKGYGSDAMSIILRYAFMELNLHRVSLNTFSYNKRAIRSYEKNGFIVEGISKKMMERDGQYWDLIWMGILREEWLKKIKESSL